MEDSKRLYIHPSDLTPYETRRLMRATDYDTIDNTWREIRERIKQKDMEDNNKKKAENASQWDDYYNQEKWKLNPQDFYNQELCDKEVERIDKEIDRIKEKGINADQEHKSPMEELADAVAEKQMIEELQKQRQEVLNKIKVEHRAADRVDEMNQEALEDGWDKWWESGEWKSLQENKQLLVISEIKLLLSKLPEEVQVEIAKKILLRSPAYKKFEQSLELIQKITNGNTEE